MEIRNLTPHEVRVVLGNGNVLTFPASGEVARVASQTVQVDQLGAIPVVHLVFGDVVGLPDPEDEVINIVSSLVRAACPQRGDLLSPGELVRDEKGAVVGCKNLQR